VERASFLKSENMNAEVHSVVDCNKFQVVGRMGGDIYSFCRSFVDLPRPEKAQEKAIESELAARAGEQKK
jgi:hypothetical protein